MCVYRDPIVEEVHFECDGLQVCLHATASQLFSALSFLMMRHERLQQDRGRSADSYSLLKSLILSSVPASAVGWLGCYRMKSLLIMRSPTTWCFSLKKMDLDWKFAVDRFKTVKCGYCTMLAAGQKGPRFHFICLWFRKMLHR